MYSTFRTPSLLKCVPPALPFENGVSTCFVAANRRDWWTCHGSGNIKQRTCFFPLFCDCGCDGLSVVTQMRELTALNTEALSLSQVHSGAHSNTMHSWFCGCVRFLDYLRRNWLFRASTSTCVLSHQFSTCNSFARTFVFSGCRLLASTRGCIEGGSGACFESSMQQVRQRRRFDWASRCTRGKGLFSVPYWNSARNGTYCILRTNRHYEKSTAITRHERLAMQERRSLHVSCLLLCFKQCRQQPMMC